MPSTGYGGAALASTSNTGITASSSAAGPAPSKPNHPSVLPAHLLTLATLRLLTLSPDARFSHVRAIPLQVLTQLTHRYLDLLALAAKKSAEQAGRTSATAKDVVNALSYFGSSLQELWDWSEDRRLGGEGVQMANSGPVEPATLGALVKEPVQPPLPIHMLEYAPLTRKEEQELASLQRSPSKLLFTELEPQSPPPPYKTPLPADPLSFLPPIPDLSAAQEAVQTIIEDETGRTVKRARRNLDGAGKSAWAKSVPYEGSTLAEFETRPLPDNPVTDSSLVTNDLDSSLPHFLETLNYVSLEQLTSGAEMLPLKQNAKRRRAATAIHSNVLNPSDDSLSGAIPTQQLRHAKKQAGWIPYPPLTDRDDPSEPSGKAIQAIPSLHPYSTMLPPSVAEALPAFVLPHPSRLLAPSMYPRQPTAHASIRTLLESTQANLFSRTTRLGPPGPLMENGAAGYYEVEQDKPVIPGWVGETAPRMMSWSFDWEIPDARGEGRAASRSVDYSGPVFPQLPSRALELAAKKGKVNGHA